MILELSIFAGLSGVIAYQYVENCKLKSLSTHDPLTGLLNKRGFDIDIAKATETAKRKNEKIAIVFIDIDNFKSVNDNLGHEQGNILLKEIAQSINNNVRKVDSVARFGGDEFIIVISDAKNKEYVEVIINRIQNSINEICNLISAHGKVSASIGAVIGLDLPHKMISQADDLMYSIKKENKNGYSIKYLE